MLSADNVKSIYETHKARWDAQKATMRKLKAAYMTRFWGDDSDMTRTEVPKAYAVIESYLGSLYSKNPAVALGDDLRGRGNPEVAQATANLFLANVRPQIEDATRLALIFPCAFLKLSPVNSVDPLKRVVASALPPWEVIVDLTAGSWDDQRYVGHIGMIPVTEASEIYETSQADFSGQTYKKFLDADTTSREESDVESWITTVEIYDLIDDRMLVWSPDYMNGDDFLFSGVTLQTGALDPDLVDGTRDEQAEDIEVFTTGIPFKSASGRPIVPIVPVYFSRDPETPLLGYSLIGRIYDQIREINLLRSYQAAGVRRMARQYLVREGFLDDEAVAKITQGIDGEIITVSLQPGQDLTDSMVAVPNSPIPADIERYAATVENDLNAAGVLAPFTRGEVTKSTATEQNLLASYTSSEIGRMARTRDGAISDIARVYNTVLAVILGDEAEPLALPNPVGPTMLSAEDLTGDFTYIAVDSGSTPASDSVKQNNFVQLIPSLVQLGVDPAKVREELIRLFKLPESFNEVVEPPMEEAPMEEAPMEEAPQDLPL
tara:strand:+ start:1381 stop:3024 length:1644 start_codon:yes stop_codon:yes gene_type:complete